MATERTPLLEDQHNFWSFSVEDGDSFHLQFCKLIGIPPTDLGPHEHIPPIPPKSLYGRALALKNSQNVTYNLTALISNSLLLSQVILGAALTALGASESSHVLITLFGAANTIIAGVVAYLKSRGQPMRARMYRDDLERVVNEIENSEVMWRGMSNPVLRPWAAKLKRCDIRYQPRDPWLRRDKHRPRGYCAERNCATDQTLRPGRADKHSEQPRHVFWGQHQYLQQCRTEGEASAASPSPSCGSSIGSSTSGIRSRCSS
jgi:SMODS and SLOG-associating 2TM effector domain